MKYLCKTKNIDTEWGVGNTLESAYDDYTDNGGGSIKDAEWFTIHPINVKLAINTSIIVKKQPVKKGVTK